MIIIFISEKKNTFKPNDAKREQSSNFIILSLTINIINFQSSDYKLLHHANIFFMKSYFIFRKKSFLDSVILLMKMILLCKLDKINSQII